jgi:predicted HTH domain antitoxin
MKTIEIQLPDELNMDKKDLLVFLAVQLYDKGRLSLGQAAEVANMSKSEFMDVLGKYEVSLFGETFWDIEQDLKNE